MGPREPIYLVLREPYFQRTFDCQKPLVRLQVVGHSQGMSALYVMLSNYPSLADKISLVGFQTFNSCQLHFFSVLSVFIMKMLGNLRKAINNLLTNVGHFWIFCSI